MPDTPSPTSALHADRPIHTAAEDRLGIDSFVRRLVGPLLHTPEGGSLVVGLYGPWGRGKTSALQLLEHALEETQAHEGEAARRTPYAAVVRFTPWLYSSVETLLPAFFDTLAGAVGGLTFAPERKREKLRGALKGMSEVVLPAAKLGAHVIAGKAGQELVEAVAGVVRGGALIGAELLDAATKDRDEARFRRQRDKAGAVLDGLRARGRPIRVVMTIDDLDRAAGVDEVLAVLKLVKLAADLPNISYVIAMDRGHIEHLLTEAVSKRFGTEFLDKIVQVGVTLPPLDPARLSRLLVEDARAVADAAGLSTAASLDVPWDQYAYEYLPQDGFERWLRPALRSLRDVARILNAYRFAALNGESSLPFHAADLLLLCVLQVVAPAAYDAVRINGPFLLHDEYRSPLGDSGRDRAAEDAARRAREARLTAIADGDGRAPVQAPGGPVGIGATSSTPAGARERPHPLAHREPTGHVVRDILRHLFPYAVTERPDRSADGNRYRQIDRDAYRLRAPERFATYFRLTPPPHQAPERLVADAFALLTGQVPVRQGNADDPLSITAVTETAGAGEVPGWVVVLDALVTSQADDAQASLYVQLGDRAAGMSRESARALAQRLPVLARHTTVVPAARITLWAEDVVVALTTVTYSNRALTIRADDHAVALDAVLALVGALGDAEAADYAENVTRHREYRPLFETEDDRRRVASAGLDRARALLGVTPDVFADLGSRGGAALVWNLRRLAAVVDEAAADAPFVALQAYLQTLVDRVPSRLSDLLFCVPATGTDGTHLGMHFAETRASLARLVPLDWAEPLVRRVAADLAAASERGDAPDPAVRWPDLVREYVRLLDEYEHAPGYGAMDVAEAPTDGAPVGA